MGAKILPFAAVSQTGYVDYAVSKVYFLKDEALRQCTGMDTTVLSFFSFFCTLKHKLYKGTIQEQHFKHNEYYLDT
jgi:hypothetical protein